MLVNAFSVVKSFYFYMKFSRLIQITKQKKGKKNRRLFPIHSHFRKYSPLHFMKKAGAALVKTITSYGIQDAAKNKTPFLLRNVYFVDLR